RIPVPSNRADALPERIAALMKSSSCWIERQRPQRRTIDLRPYLLAFRWLPGALEMDLVVTPNGTARPEEVLQLLGLAELLEEGAVFERTHVELDDVPAPTLASLGNS